jgi:hypothetical protein
MTTVKFTNRDRAIMRKKADKTIAACAIPAGILLVWASQPAWLPTWASLSSAASVGIGLCGAVCAVTAMFLYFCAYGD